MIDYVQETLKALRPNDPDWYGWKDYYIDDMPNPNLISYENAISIKDGVTKPSKDEFDAKYNEIVSSQTLINLRNQRNFLLSQSDWRDLPSYPGSNQEAWRTYRQQLRDLPSTTDPGNPTWPTAPEND